MPLRKGYGVGKPEIGVAVGIGVSVAAVAGLAAGAALRTGVLTVGAVSNARRGIKPALEPEDVKWDAQGRIVNWSHVLKIVQQGVSAALHAHSRASWRNSSVVPEALAILNPTLFDSIAGSITHYACSHVAFSFRGPLSYFHRR